MEAFLETMPFSVDLSATVAALSAGEKQKLEILKQLYLDSRILIFDEPTSVLTPGEADEILGLLRRMTQANELSVLMITHKLREVGAYAERVTVLRQGRVSGTGLAAELSPTDLTQMMVGTTTLPKQDGARATRRPARPPSSSPSSPPKMTRAIERLPASRWRCVEARSWESPACPATVSEK